MARAGSLATFFIAHAGRPGEQPVRVELDPDKQNEPAAATLVDLSDRLFGDGPGTAQAINRALKHLQGNGESILRVSNDDATDGYQLHAHAVQELSGMPGAWKINDGQQTYDLDDSDLLIRSWTPHPQREYLPFSPVRSVMPIAYELIALTKAVAASTDSQLAGAGVVVVPEDAQVVGGGAVTINDDGTAVISPGAGGLAEEIVEAALTAIKDRDSVAAVAPVVATTSGKEGGKVEHITFSTPLDERMGELREEAIRRLALGMDSPPEVLLGQGDTNHWCTDDATEVLSIDGWKRQHELAVGDVVLTLNHETGLSEWKPVLDIYRAAVVDEPMRYMETQRHNSLTTMAHRWPVLRDRWEAGEPVQRREWTTSGELDRTHAIITGAPHADTPDVAKHSDALVELVAWYWTEGNLGAGGRATIAQSHTVNAPRVDRIRAALSTMFGPGLDTLRGSAGPAWRESVQSNSDSHGGPVTVFSLNRAASAILTEHAEGREKLVRTEFVRALTRAQLELFIDVSCQGDGWHYRHGKLDVWQKNPRALDAFELALILSGRAVSRHESGGGEAVSALQNTRQRPGKSRNGHRDQVVELYTGTVWCPTTENRTWFARRNGQVFYTGNSAWQISEEEIRLVVAPLLATVAHALTVGWLQPSIQQLSSRLGGLDPADFVVWFDTTPLELRPDRSADAKELHALGVISDAALRRECGFTEDDRPDDDARVAAVAKELLALRPDLVNQLFVLMGLPLSLIHI